MKFEATLAELIVGGAVVGHFTVHAATRLPVERRVAAERRIPPLVASNSVAREVPCVIGPRLS